MNILVHNPNFSIVTPFGCNAKCSFCFWKGEDNCSNFFKNLQEVLNKLPKNFNSISLTGGEPTTNVDGLLEIVKMINKRYKVVLTSNSYNLSHFLERLTGGISHINISRHSISDTKNNEIFQSKLANTDELKFITKIANNKGIDITLSAVLNDELSTKDDILEYINFAKKVGANAVFFRKTHGNLEKTSVEKEFDDLIKIDVTCPVCRNTEQIIEGMKVTWKASIMEPSNKINGIFELIYQQNGDLTSDWAGKNKIILGE